MAAAGPGDPATAKAAEYLVRQQNNDGSWSEIRIHRHRFSCVFYLKYHLYRNSFPVYALARFHNQTRKSEEFRAFLFQPGEFRLRSGF